MSELPIDLASVDWLYVAELWALIFLSTSIGTLALMFAAVWFFWTYYPEEFGSAQPTQKLKIRKRLRQREPQHIVRSMTQSLFLCRHAKGVVRITRSAATTIPAPRSG